MKRLLSAVASLALAFGVQAIAPLPVAAAGNCNLMEVNLWSNTNRTGAVRVFCYGNQGGQYAYDTDVSSESPVNIMGPLAQGATYQNDFDTITGNSGIGSMDYWQTGTSYRICFYTGTSYGSLVSWQSSAQTAWTGSTEYASISSWRLIDKSNLC